MSSPRPAPSDRIKSNRPPGAHRHATSHRGTPAQSAPLLAGSCSCVRHDPASCDVTHRDPRLPLSPGSANDALALLLVPSSTRGEDARFVRAKGNSPTEAMSAGLPAKRETRATPNARPSASWLLLLTSESGGRPFRIRPTEQVAASRRLRTPVARRPLRMRREPPTASALFTGRQQMLGASATPASGLLRHIGGCRDGVMASGTCVKRVLAPGYE